MRLLEKLRIKYLILLVVLAAGVLCNPCWALDALRVNVVDVGQSEAILIELPNYDTILIDSGDRYDAKALIRFLESRNIQEINYLVVTHPHDDHIGGMDEVLEQYPVGTAYCCNVQVPSSVNLSFMEKLKAKEVPTMYPSSGDVLIEEPNLKLEVVSSSSQPHELLNNSSLVLKLTYGNKKFLFTGDAEFQAEGDMLASGVDLKADVLKMGHHGSGASSSAAFLKAVKPSIGLISVGKNKYGLPGNSALNRMAQIGADVYRTDVMGTIILICDGDHIVVNNEHTWKPAPPKVVPTLDSEEAKRKKLIEPGQQEKLKSSKNPRIP